MSKVAVYDRTERQTLILSVLQILYCVLVLLVLLPEGSVKSLPLDLISVPVFLLAGLTAFILRPATQHRSVYRVAVGMALILVLWGWLQSYGFVGNPFANPVWRAASDVLGPIAGSISIVPADTRAAIIPVVLPFAIFTSGLLIFPTDTSAKRLLQFLAITGGLVALYGLIQYEFFPDSLMFRKKEYYLRDLTSVLVNRNSIATYIGAALLLNAGFLFDSLLPITPQRGRGGTVFYRHRHLRVSWLTVLYGSMVFFTFVALLLTRSRAGTAATFVALFGLMAFFMLESYRRINQRSGLQSSSAARFTRGAAIFAGSAVVTLVFAFLGGRVIMRADLQGFEDGRFCAYPSMVDLLKDNWIFGTGLGSFSEAYVRYMNPLCGKNILWDRAHSFYLEGWIDLGVIFLPLVAITVFGLLFVFSSGSRKRKSLRWVPATGLAVLLLFLMHSIVDFSIQIPGVAVSFAAIMSGAVVLSLNRNKSARKSEQIARPSPVPGAAATRCEQSHLTNGPISGHTDD